jgi:hypothetical protein
MEKSRKKEFLVIFETEEEEKENAFVENRTRISTV